MKKFIDVPDILWYLAEKEDVHKTMLNEAEEMIQALLERFNKYLPDAEVENNFYMDLSELINKYLEDGFVYGFKTAQCLLN